MTSIDRRSFCAALGAGLVGLVAGCSPEGDTAPSGPAADAPLAGRSFEVRRDPG